MEQSDYFSTLDRWAETLNVHWDGGCRNGSELWRRLRAAGFGGSLRIVTEWKTHNRRATKAGMTYSGPTTTVPSARTIARLLTSERDCRSVEALRIRIAIDTASPRIVAARNLLDRFRAMIAVEKSGDLASWLQGAAGSELASFAAGIQADEAAVYAAIVEPWSNGQTEGQVTQAQARQAPDVRPRQARPPPRQNGPNGMENGIDQRQKCARATVPSNLTNPLAPLNQTTHPTGTRESRLTAAGIAS